MRLNCHTVGMIIEEEKRAIEITGADQVIDANVINV
jgi:hypothetical protein